jgi:outer membrane protein
MSKRPPPVTGSPRGFFFFPLSFCAVFPGGSGMKFGRPVILLLVLSLALLTGRAQSVTSYRSALPQQVRSGKLRGPQHLNDYVKDGKLSLNLRDAILLALENSSDVEIDESQIQDQKMSVLNTYGPFDPLLQGTLQVNRTSSPGYTELQGVGQSSNATFNSLSQTGTIQYTQTLQTGTNFQASISSNKYSTNSSFYYYNPFFNSSLNFQVIQPLLRGAGRFANIAPIIIARAGLAQSRANFEAEVSDAILRVVQQYWAAVQARGNVDVSQKSYDLAEASYEHEKRALELGALPPLDIYRSQSEVAARHVQVLQTEYALTQAQEDLRLTIGADQDDQIRKLPLDLTESSEVKPDSETMDMEALLAKALSRRPEIEAAARALDGDRANIRLARNQRLPNLSFTGIYQSNGLGGNQYNLLTGQLISLGGFESSFGQLGGFGYPTYGGTLQLALPLKNHAADATLGTAMVTQNRDLTAAQQAREVITREVSNAVHQMEEAKLALAAAKTSYDLAQKSLQADQRKYELGAETNFFVLDSQTRLAQTELVLLQTQVGYQLARAALYHATGEILDPYQVQIRELAK